MALHECESGTIRALLGDLSEVGDLDSYADVALQALAAVVPTDLAISFNVLRQEPLQLLFSRSAPSIDDRVDVTEAMARLWRQSPTSTVNVGVRGGVYRWSDLISRHELEGLDFFHEVNIPVGERFTTKLVFSGGPYESDAFMLTRTAKDFSDHEVDILRFVFPFLMLAYRVVEARWRAQRVEAELASHGIGIVQVRAGGRVVGRLGAADDLLTSWFPQPARDELPVPLDGWLVEARRGRPENVPTPLVVHRDRRSLVVRFAPSGGERPDELVLEELGNADAEDTVAASLGLTVREVEVLELVRDGMTNREIGDVLSISHTTVRRHLENVFSKLDVSTRTAAVARAFPIRT